MAQPPVQPKLKHKNRPPFKPPRPKPRAKVGSPTRPEDVKEKLSAPIYRNILADLVAFTGFSEDEVCFRIAKKRKAGFGARGWFNEEFDFFNPQTPADYDWYYRASQAYIFTNARRAWWGHIGMFGIDDQPILDYGAGIGQNVLEFYYRDMPNTWYFELGTLQTEFFKFRVERHMNGVCVPKVVRPFWKDRFDPINCLRVFDGTFGLVILQDVLEHVHNYHLLLGGVVAALRPGGRIIEHSPFAVGKQDKTGAYPHMHLPDKVGLQKVMANLGMKVQTNISPTKNDDTKFTVRVWVKA